MDNPMPAWGVRALAWIVVASVIILAVAFGFEHIGGFRPCPLCLMERYAYYFAIAAGAIGLASVRTGVFGVNAVRVLLVLIALGYLVNAGLGVYHSGVEWQWWPGPDTCSGPLPSLSAGPLDLERSVIRCDAAPWRMVGLSFAGWNAVLSLGLVLLAVKGALPDAGRTSKVDRRT